MTEYKSVFLDTSIFIYFIEGNKSKLRSKNSFLKGMDSFQLASCLSSKCDYFITNDKQLKKVKDINCLLINEWEGRGDLDASNRIPR